MTISPTVTHSEVMTALLVSTTRASDRETSHGFLRPEADRLL